MKGTAMPVIRGASASTPSETTTLVRSGVFGWVRNPIFTAMLVFGLGIALVTPNVVAILGFALLVVTIELQVRVVEEPYLSNVHGEAYRDYRATSAGSSRVSASVSSALTWVRWHASR
jgi:protein-S-isoprenylcysteine O-methyltransferase Ste14